MKMILSLILLFSAHFSFAQAGPCQVVMVNQYHRIVGRFNGYRDYRNGICRDALRNCNYEIQSRRIYGVRCLEVRYPGWKALYK